MRRRPGAGRFRIAADVFFRKTRTACYGSGRELCARVGSNPAPMITHRMAIEDIADASETAASKAGGAIKVVVTL